MSHQKSVDSITKQKGEIMINVVQGDLFDYPIESNSCIIHVCNDIGKFGKGFVVPLAKYYPEAKSEYIKLNTYKLGTVQYVKTKGIFVGNMIAQHKVWYTKGKPPIRYEALNKCLHNVSEWGFTAIHLPYLMGCGLAGGEWEIVYSMIKKYMFNRNVYIHKL